MSGSAGPPIQTPSRIKALDKDVVNKIAAGEVIVGPVNALKELTENAIDAGATSIEVLVKDGGLKLLQITDNGHGINCDDLPILCERHTTSKLKAFEDLTAIGTYGFRGEALASISHIAHLRVTTRTKQSSCAWQAHFQDGKLVAPKPGQSAEPKACAGRQGTQLTVEDLFYNITVRRKAFRSASEEYAKILDLVGKYAVHCAGVAFTCKKHGDASMGVTVQQSANTVERIRTIHGSAVANELIPVEAQSERWGFKADGWVSNANYHVKKLVLLLFINHRSVESTPIKKALEQAFSTFLPKGGHPFVYLSLEIEPHRVDVNVHPTKREVRFLHEDEIVETVCEEIRAKLGKVDTSRTFMTQSLLTGVKIPTISADTMNTPRKPSSSLSLPTSDTSTQKQPDYQGPKSTLRTPAPKTNENNLVRTDANLRKITSMLPPLQRPSQQNSSSAQKRRRSTSPTSESPAPMPQSKITYTLTDTPTTVCRLTSIKRLRSAVRETAHNSLTETLATHTFVGIVDPTRRIAAIQSGVRLLLVDYALLCNEYFYQVGLTDFGNFGTIRLDPPLSILQLLRIGATREREIESRSEGGSADIDWDEVPRTVGAHLVNQRAMLAEYFSIKISEEGDLLSLPLLVRDYEPSMAKLPQFLLRLGPHVEWGDEMHCFRSFLRELARWYVPEALPAEVKANKIQPENEGAPDDVEMGGMPETSEEHEDPQIAARRKEVYRVVEHVLFPAFKSKLIATKGMLKGVVEIANLKGLYRVFERC